MQRFDPRELR